MATSILDKINHENLRTDGGDAFKVGDMITVHVKIKEGEKERIQLFKGTVIARDGKDATETFTVRRLSYGVGVERVFPIHSPFVEKIEVERASHVRRAKLYFLRRRVGKQARLRGANRVV